MQRAECWQHADGPVATLETIKCVFLTHRELLVTKNLKIYESDDMAQNRDLDLLVAAKGLLSDLMALDTRGGYFAQTDVQTALVNCMDEPSQTRLLGLVHSSGLEVADVFHTIGYRVRVMLAHARRIHDEFFAVHFSKRERNHPLKDLLTYLHGHMKRDASKRSASRQLRLMKRPHPFPAFRKEESDTEIEERPTIVSRHYNVVKRKAEMLTSDGGLHNADFYKEGAEGFIVAVWLEPAAEIVLEVANKYLLSPLEIGVAETKPRGDPKPKKEPKAKPVPKPKADPKPKAEPAAKVAKILKKPAAAEDLDHEDVEAVEAAEEDPMSNDDGEGEGELAEEEEERVVPSDQEQEEEGGKEETCDKSGIVELKLAAGHDQNMTLVIKAGDDYKDKAQILEVTQNQMRGGGKTPLQVCQHVQNQLAPLLPELSLPVRGAKWLKHVRECAKREAKLCLA